MKQREKTDVFVPTRVVLGQWEKEAGKVQQPERAEPRVTTSDPT